MKNEYIIGQALHGYDNGHREIALSERLGDRSKRLITTLSDLPQSRLVQGFETYLTGYPLQEDNYYVLARTWYADDQSRPGCVWTHSLLIPFATLSAIDHLRSLEPLLRRPPTQVAGFGGRQTRTMYAKGIRFTETGRSEFIPRYSRSDALQLLKQLYNHVPDGTSEFIPPFDDALAPVAMHLTDRKGIEDLLLNVWSQQWGALRRRFTFSTGSIVNRNRPKQLEFDVQVFPSREPLPVTFSRELPTWLPIEATLNAAADDIISPNEHLRERLKRFGQDFSSGRGVFIPLFFITEKSTQSPTDPVEELRTVASLFPNASDAAALKFETLSRLGNHDVLEALKAIITFSREPFGHAFDKHESVFESWLSNKDSTDIFDLMGLILSCADREYHPLREKILHLVCEQLTPHDLDTLGKDRNALMTALAQRPEIALWSGFWNRPVALQRAGLDVLIETLNLNHPLWVQLTEAIVKEDGLARYGLQRVGLPMIRQIVQLSKDVNWVEQLSDRWLLELRHDEVQLIECCLQEMRHPGVALLVCLAVKEPWLHISVDTASLFVEKILPTSHHPQTLIALCHAFTIALRGSGKKDFQLLMLTLPHLYHAQLHERLPESALDTLLPLLPDFTWRNWDYCERIVGAVADWIRRHEADVEYEYFDLTERFLTLPKQVKAFLQNQSEP